MAPTPGVVTCCNLCHRPLGEDELWGADCVCGGTLNQTEDAIELEIERLRKLQAESLSHQVVTGTDEVKAI